VGYLGQHKFSASISKNRLGDQQNTDSEDQRQASMMIRTFRLFCRSASLLPTAAD